MELFDSHAHYDDEKFDIDRDEVIPEIYNSGITKFLSCGYSLEGSIKALEIAKKYDYIYTSVGISPNDLSENWKEDIKEIDQILEHELSNQIINNDTAFIKNTDKLTENKNKPIQSNEYNQNKNEAKSKIVAVGEIGLDYHYDTDRECQKEAFISQIKMANKYNLPIIIHTRDAYVDTIAILKENPANKKGVFHCCPFNRELIKDALNLGFFISIAGPVTFKNSKNAEEIVKMIPLDRMLIETDSPYLAPEPVRGTRNDSRNVRYIAEKVAGFKRLPLEEIAEKTYENTEKVFEIK